MVFFQLFANNPKLLRVPAGEVLFREGDDGQVLYVLTEGTANITVKGYVVEEMVAGSIVGEMCLVAPGPRSATVQALTDCQFAEIDEKRFHYLVQQTPFFAIQVMKIMAERLRNADRAIASLINN
ncbi:MAG: hypothetical protein RIR00_513 [Pseudomonadota bacterium]|jgi:CRP-like cAMP-binding protein